MVGLRDPEARPPRTGDKVFARKSEVMWVSELEDEFVKVRDEAGFSFRIRVDRLSWAESNGMWGWVEDIEPDPETDEQPGREGWPEFNGAFGRGGRA